MYAPILSYVTNIYQNYDFLHIIQRPSGSCIRTPPLKSQINGIEKFTATKLCLSNITNPIPSHDISIIKPRVKKLRFKSLTLDHCVIDYKKLSQLLVIFSEELKGIEEFVFLTGYSLDDATLLFHPLIWQKNLRVFKFTSTTAPEIKTIQEKKFLRLFHQVKEFQYPLCKLSSHFFKNLATKADISNLQILSVNCLGVDEGVVSQTFFLVQQLCGIGLLKEVGIKVYGNIEMFLTSQLLRKNNGIKWEVSSSTFQYFRVGVKYLFDSAIKMENNIIRESKIIFKNFDYRNDQDFSFVHRVLLISPENWDKMVGRSGDHYICDFMGRDHF
eukprot:snap_masked-scaffold_17-processed-gene-6.61-mRNA-1 protein AED:1.00 eAED:1.00 QI:0/0/0/0/1/1/2/0/328